MVNQDFSPPPTESWVMSCLPVSSLVKVAVDSVSTSLTAGASVMTTVRCMVIVALTITFTARLCLSLMAV